MQTQPADEAATQSIHDRSLIDHLIATFHSDDDGRVPAGERPKPVYDLIRREWPSSLTFGTAR